MRPERSLLSFASEPAFDRGLGPGVGDSLADVGGPDRPRLGDLGDSASLAAGRAGARRARRARLATGTAIRQANGGPTPTAASAAFRHDLLVLVIAGRADTALGAPGVDAPRPATANAYAGAAAGRASPAYPARGGFAPQVQGGLATRRASRSGNTPMPGHDQLVGYPHQHKRDAAGVTASASGCSRRSASNSRSARP
jgi:hypothetical protein